MRKLIFILVLFLSHFRGNTSHLMGGEITWQCQGTGEYVFQLKLYRDCLGPSVSTLGQYIKIWNHPALDSIPISLVSQIDISPACTQVAGGPAQITCASPGNGAIEQYTFQSAPVFISGVPPAQGWAFTYSSFSRNLAVDNLQSPATYGITIRALMFSFNGQNTQPCFDSSPQFLENPATVVCSGDNFEFNPNAYDPDNDSLVFSFAQPLDRIDPGSPQFNPPVSPVPVPYITGYSFTNPTPDASFALGNIGSAIDPETGEISFTSNTLGNFVIVVKTESYRCGQKIAEVYREMQVVILNCGANTAPVVTPPFAGGTSFDTTVYAGALVNFTLDVTDNELLQDGTPQTVTLTPTGNQFGAGFSNAAIGCTNPPCAILSDPMPLSGVQGLTTNFSWQTSCTHVVTSNCETQGTVYKFLMKVSDDYCSVPGQTNATVSIKVLPPPTVVAPDIRCADVALNGDVTLTWVPPNDPLNNFHRYEIYNVTSGTLLTTIFTIGTNTFTDVGADAQFAPVEYCIVVKSGCNNNQTSYSDTISTMFITMNNPGDGTAMLNWNAMYNPNIPSSDNWYHIWQEYPLGTWTLIDSVPYGTNNYRDTISICSDTVNYKISIGDAQGCESFSSIRGDNFTDIIEPYPPIITFATVDTTTNHAQINWNPNPAEDTQGYIILQNIGGNWVVIDTIYGINNTSYTNPNSLAGTLSEIYGVAAFDSCWSGNPPSPNTSAMGNNHSTIFLESELNICAQEVLLTWNAYINWNNGVSTYDIYASENNGPFALIASLNNTTFSYLHTGVNRGSVYRYIVKANQQGSPLSSLSNITQKLIKEPQQPTFGYLQTATVLSDNEVLIRYNADLSASVLHYRIERSNDFGNSFFTVAEVTGSVNPVQYIDNANTTLQDFIYRVIVVDSCGDDVHLSNIGHTIFTTAVSNSPYLTNTVQWNKYEQWDGNIQEYRIYRSINGNFDPSPVAVVPPGTLYYIDEVEDYLQSTGEFCYKVEAIESGNPSGTNETSISNAACAIQEALVYIPNAFTPEGNNPIFLPIVSYVDFNDYTLQIFNRWGEMLFETNDVTMGWDGTFKSKRCTEDVYVYQVSFKTGDGKPFVKRGFVTLLNYPKQ